MNNKEKLNKINNDEKDLTKKNDQKLEIKFTPSQDSGINSFSVKKTENELMKDEIISQEQIINPNGTSDINKDLGKFHKKTDVSKEKEEEKMSLDDIKKELNFDKFSKKKPKKKFNNAFESNSKNAEKFGIILRNKKGLLITWGIEATIMVIFIMLSGLYIGLISPHLNVVDPTPPPESIFNIFGANGPYNISIIYSCALVGYIFSIINLSIIFFPLLFLLTSWFVGINDVYKSITFHYFFIIILIICFVIMIIGSSLSLTAIVADATFPG